MFHRARLQQKAPSISFHLRACLHEHVPFLHLHVCMPMSATDVARCCAVRAPTARPHQPSRRFSSHLVCGTTGARSLGNYPNMGCAPSQAGLRSSQPVAKVVCIGRAPPDSFTSRGHVLLECLGWADAEDVEFQGALSLGLSRPGGGGGGPSVVPPGLLRWFLFGRQGVGLLGLALFSGFARLKLLAVRAFEFGVTGPVQRNLRLWARLSSNPGLDGPRR